MEDAGASARGSILKDFEMWVEMSKRKRKCHRCGNSIEVGAVYVKFGEKDRPLRVTCVCGQCFEKLANQLFDEFQGLKNQIPPPEPQVADIGFRCFTCGKSPEQCMCGREAYA